MEVLVVVVVEEEESEEGSPTKPVFRSLKLFEAIADAKRVTDAFISWGLASTARMRMSRLCESDR